MAGLKFLKYSALSIFAFPFLYVNGGGSPSSFSPYYDKSGTLTIPVPEDSSKKDTSKLPYPFHDRITDKYSNDYDHSPLYGTDPSNINGSIEYNPETREYDINERMGDGFYRDPSYMTFEEFKEDQFKRSTSKYWKDRSDGEDALTRKPLIPKIYVGGEAFDRIFGGNSIDIRPQGSATLDFAYKIQRTDNPQIPEKQRRVGSFDFQEQIQMNVIGNIGEKMKLSVNYNTEASFDFENQMKLEYTGYDDEIIRKIEAGNVSLPLTGSLIRGSQSLFGIKTQLQFGRLGVTSIFSQQKGQASTINVPPGGGQLTEFEIESDQYEENRHFFISQYFYDNYDKSLAQLPTILSNISISKIEVWVTQTNFNASDNTRDLVALQDLGEYNYYATSFVGQGTSIYPSDSLSNDLYKKMTTSYGGVRNFQSASAVLDPLSSSYNFSPQQDYELITNAKKLTSSDFTYNERLGYISLNSELRNDQALAVAFEYTINGKVYRVGELTTTGVDPSKSLIVKLVRGRNFNTSLPSWKLMMKNVYNLNAFQISKDKFKLDVLYFDNGAGSDVRQLPEPNEPNLAGISLIRVLNTDNLNSQGDASRFGDGVFDFVEGLTVNSATGRIFLPSTEPFGSYLENKFVNKVNADKYTFDELYDSTKTIALAQGKNKFKLKGSYQSTGGSEISLNAINIPQGSVKVTSGGVELVENSDYTVDYNLGRVKIINSSVLNSATPIQVSLESNSLFAVQTKTLMGSRFDYKFNKDFSIGGTVMRLSERPITQKVNVGDEPIANTIFGVDGTYRTQSRFITKLVDKLPFINTKEISSVSLNGEFAYLLPGHPKAIGKSGNAYIDDFEGTQSPITLTQSGQWYLASVPRYQNDLEMFPEYTYVNNTQDTLGFGYNRAKLAWYNIDASAFFRQAGSVFDFLPDNARTDNNTREILETEIFPNRTYNAGQLANLTSFDLAFYPDERGPYNYNTDSSSSVFKGTNLANGKLNEPKTRWGGIMRRVETSNFEESNIQYIQLWMMDPFNGDAPDSLPGNTGQLYFNLGDISEDILRDGVEMYENGLPTSAVDSTTDTTAWGRVPRAQPILYAFDNDLGTRPFQDVGLDGLNNAGEAVQFQSNFLTALQNLNLNADALAVLQKDPSSDDFSYFRNDSLNNIKASALARYKSFNGTEGNSPVTSSSNASSTTLPDAEDINRQNGMEVDENYFQYKLDIDPNKLVVGQNYVSDMIEAPVPGGGGKTVKYYLIKIPVNDIARQKFGQISDLKSVKFIRVFAKGFANPIVMRFARFEFLRGDWRKYDYNIKTCDQCDQPGVFDVGAVSLEENGDRVPINYVLPPDFQREIDVTSTNQRQLNEQSLSVKMCELGDGDLRAVYKNTSLDMRNYKHVKMVIHAESFQPPAAPLNDGDLYATVRLGTDFKDNYYEYRIPLKITPFGSTDPTVIWPKENDFDIDLTKLTDAKLARNNQGTPFSQEFVQPDGANFIIVKGNPTLSEVRIMMLGVWNPDKELGEVPVDDGLNKCVEVWFNEFRMTDFNEKGGWATIGRAQIKLADLGNISISGGHSTHGFGSLESKLAERSKEDVTNYDVATSLELGKFFPTNIGLTIPLYLGYGEVFSNPQYDPLDPDIEFSRSLNSIEDGERRKNRKKISQDYTRRKSLNLTNVKKNKVGKNASKSHLYDIENFNFTYGYTEVYRRNISTEYDLQKDYLGAIGYNFNTNPKPFTPFSKIKGKSKYWRPIKDFNFNYMPTSFNFRWDVNRHYGETQLRDVNSVVANSGNSDVFIPVLYDKRFTMNRQYGTAWDITKSLKFDFNANNQSKIDEPDGSLDGKRDSVERNFFKLGRNTDYMHDASLSYNVPLSKLPITDWINLTTRYTATYHWTASPLVINPETGASYTNPAIGNTIQNSNTKQANVSFNMTSLYGKWKFYKKLTAPPKPKNTPKKETKPEPKKETTAADSSKTKTVKPPEKKKETEISPAVKFIAKMVFSLKNVSFNYNQTNGLLLPGFNRQSEWLGQNWDDPTSAPGFGFTFGDQAESIKEKAAKYKWLTTDSNFNSQFTKTYMENLTGRASLEPIAGLNIDLNISRNFTKNTTENYRTFQNPNNPEENIYDALSRTEGGNFSMSYFTWKTAFIKDRKDYTSSIFETFAQNRQVISDRLGKERGTNIDPNTGFRDGYSGTSQDVLILSFLSAYTKTDPSKMSLNLFPSIPKPNWTVRYDGLSKLPFAKRLFQSVNLNHGYRSTYSVNTFTTDVNYFNDPNTRDINNDFIAQRQIGQVTLSEQYSPLLGIDITWKNAADKSAAKKSSASTSRGGSSGGNISTRVEFKRDRTISLALAGIQITEVKGNELTVGLGYRIPNFKFPFGLFNSISSKKANDLNTTLDFSIRKNNTVLRKLVENTNQPTSGLTIISIKLSSDYTVNERLNLRFFFDKTIQTPVVSTSYPNSNTSIGLSIRFTLSQ